MSDRCVRKQGGFDKLLLLAHTCVHSNHSVIYIYREIEFQIAKLVSVIDISETITLLLNRYIFVPLYN